ncbi:lactosylceramide alpha-2,3-sialyltransferase isoform X2 [Narcine bancroftii]|uniref:lactosylceramide alpha-2,3-sialyltransferase isoform X2 n=1 Tax=Narcine bancroftii TaxID=1343680 RepID=UPI003831134A
MRRRGRSPPPHPPPRSAVCRGSLAQCPLLFVRVWGLWACEPMKRLLLRSCTLIINRAKVTVWSLMMRNKPNRSRRLTALIVFCLIGIRSLIKFMNQDEEQNDIWNLYLMRGEKNKNAQKYAGKVLEENCRPSFVQQQMAILFPQKYNPVLHPFLDKSSILRDAVFKYNTPFGFKNHQNVSKHLIHLMPMVSLPKELERNPCKRCIVLGSGGILRGLGLGHLLDKFDIVIRLNNAPIQGFTQDVGNKTTIRMSYPEGAPKSTLDYDPYMLFVAVMYKGVDFSWLNAMIKREQVSFWENIWFWQKVAKKVPIKPAQFRILNPEIIMETAIDLLQLPEPRKKLWGWDQHPRGPDLSLSIINLKLMAVWTLDPKRSLTHTSVT